MRRIVVIIATLAALGAAAAVVVSSHHPATATAAPSQPSRGRPAAADAGLLTGPLDAFGLDMLAREAQATSGNVVISPLSISDVLSLLLNGARGRTATEMRHALGLDGMATPAADQAWADLVASVQAGRRPAVQVADSLWLRHGVGFSPAFLATARDSFGAGALPLPNDPGQAADAVNTWVDAHTAGLIRRIVEPGYFNEDTILAVVNTVHAKAAWRTAFEKGATAPRAFTLAAGSVVRVPTMSGPLNGPVTRTAACDAVALATKGPLTAWVIVPRGAGTPESLLAGLSGGGLDALERTATPQAVMLELPRLHTTFSTPDLKPELQALGMVAAFSPQDADLQGIVAPGTPGRVYIQRVVHKAVFDVGEGGVEAAAATAGIVGITSAPEAPLTIRADRPFLFLLTDSRTRAPLFMALIRDPRA